ncbi:MAG: glutamate--tRNA ligase [Halanaerobiales bacterium]
MNEIRLRFPPSPTGKIHIGNIRTALFNWLWARKKKGKLILRIEDTDRERSAREFENIIIRELDWLGIDIDEGIKSGGDYGPYRQSERLDIYQKYAQKLLEEDKAYRCYCQPEELEEMRQKALEKGEMPCYDGRCRNLTPAEEQAYREEGRKPVLRFKLPAEERELVVKDKIRGEVEFNTSVLDDFVIFKSDGMPTYNFAVVIDDALMKISHIIRGEDHLSNTPKQILIYEALEFDIPVFAHLPLILDEDRAKLKKRSDDDTVYIGEYREKGYLPEALFNFLALLGWSPPEEEEILSREELVEHFELKDINKAGAVFDLDKLNWMNGVYIREADPERILDLSLPYLEEAGYIESPLESKERERLLEVIKVGRTKVDYLAQMPEKVALFFEELEYEDRDRAKEVFQEEGVRLVFSTLQKKLEKMTKVNADNINEMFKEMKKELPVGARMIYHPVRVALTGRESGPELIDVINILGKEESIRRLQQALLLTDQ